MRRIGKHLNRVYAYSNFTLPHNTSTLWQWIDTDQDGRKFIDCKFDMNSSNFKLGIIYDDKIYEMAILTLKLTESKK